MKKTIRFTSLALWVALAIAAISILFGGCALNHTVVVSTGTVIGVEVSQNPQTGLYSAKLGYDRGELALVPYTNGYVPDVVTEIRYNNIFSFSSAGIYQRMAVGPNAVTQPGATALFLKDANGNLGTNAVNFLKSVPLVNPVAQGSLAKVASYYGASTNKPAWDAVALTVGYPSFSALLADPKVTPDVAVKVIEGLRLAKLIL